jgi:hypothetical protein
MSCRVENFASLTLIESIGIRIETQESLLDTPDKYRDCKEPANLLEVT